MVHWKDMKKVDQKDHLMVGRMVEMMVVKMVC